ncbi:MAG: dinitrogenase iron-molybdenum cofactor biosynthesis protein [bacterium]|nr:dinitrogenase iron-molybdenum cofactor biosynthesis protein [bacterium]
MKIAIAVENNAGSESKLDQRFGRAAYFLVYDSEEKKILSVVENKFKDLGHGVGIKVGTLLVEEGCSAVIGPQTGPKLVEILKKACVKIITEDTGTVKEALERHLPEITA